MSFPAEHKKTYVHASLHLAPDDPAPAPATGEAAETPAPG